MRFLPPTVKIGDTVHIDVRGDQVPATVVKPPIVAATPSRPVD